MTEVLGYTDSDENACMLFYLYVIKSILVRRFVLVFHVIKTVVFKLLPDTFFIFICVGFWQIVINQFKQAFILYGSGD